MAKVIVKIAKNGESVSVEAQGIKGPACISAIEPALRKLDGTVEHQDTDEMFESNVSDNENFVREGQWEAQT
jgi:hypothetical protein